MNKKMLIDATHPEETRVVVVNGHKVEEFDFDSSASNLITGNIYLAKVTRVEPSLQAAFVDYGGNRHGFLAFAEIHPDYYQIPVADREALMAEELARQAEVEKEEDAEEAGEDNAKPARQTRAKKSRTVRKSSRSKKTADTSETETAEAQLADDAVETADDSATAENAPAENSSDTVEEVATPNNDGDDAPNTTIAQAAHNDEVKGPVLDDAEISGKNSTNDESTAEKPAPKKRGRPRKSTKAKAAESTEAEVVSEAAAEDAPTDEPTDTAATDDADAPAAETEAKPARKSRTRRKKPSAKKNDPSPLDDPREADETNAPVEIDEEITAETIEANEDDEEDIRPVAKSRPSRPHMRYKIQEVVKPRQIMLVQVIKEERGNKGAALTTYLSLPGRYCVLMPNTARGGGISRKISNVNDRKRLRALAKDFNVPQGAGLIIRTAGAKRDSAEISRDYEFLTRQWNQIRELTLASTAPAPIYAESGPIKRAVRDLLTSDTKEILIEGREAYDEAREYVELLMPDRVDMVKEYDGKMPLFARYQVESYLGDMFNPTVQLKSGGYLVIGVTEALIAIDVNSGKSTKEGSIEDTALKTNLEAAEEVARQLKLRDLAGLIVIDFIDMDQRRNRSAVENKLKDALKGDRARIQVGRISSFGLLEMSRQRLRTGLVEAITQPCEHCLGTGIQRSDDNAALSVLRAIEEEIGRGKCNEINASVSPAVANYLFNEKRDHIQSFMDRHGVLVRVFADAAQHGANYSLEKLKNNNLPKPTAQPITASSVIEDQANNAPTEEASTEERPKRKRSRGGRGRNRRNSDADANATTLQEVDGASVTDAPIEGANAANAAQSDTTEKPKRGRRKKSEDKPAEVSGDQSSAQNASSDETPSKNTDAAANAETEAPAKPKRKRRTKAEIEADKAAKSAEVAVADAVTETDDAEKSTEKPKRAPRKSAKSAAKAAEVASESTSEAAVSATSPVVVEEAKPVEAAPAEAEAKPAKPVKKKKGWWSL